MTSSVDNKYILYHSKDGAIAVFVITFCILVINFVALIIHRNKISYRCSCFRMLISSVLSSMLIATFICFSCNILLVFVVYVKVKNRYIMQVYTTCKFMSVWAEFVSICHILLISVQRYIAVIYPFKINGCWMICHSKVVCSTIWSSTLLVFIGLIATNFLVDSDLYHYSELVLGYSVLVIIIILAYVYVFIVIHLTKRHLNKDLKTNTTNLRAVFISMALGIAFCISFLPRAIHVILYSDRHLTWTVYLYITSYSFDSLLIISRFIYENYYLKKSKMLPTKLMYTSSGTSQSTI